MNNGIDYFINQLQLNGLVEKNGNYNVACPICGNSNKSVSMKKGWFMVSDDGEYATFHCFNTGLNFTFSEFLEKIGEIALLDEFTNQKKQSYMKTRDVVKKKKINTIKADTKMIYKKLSSKSFESIKNHPDHLQYMRNRLVPKEIIKNCLVYTGNKWYNNYVVIPFINGDRIYGFQARSIIEKSFYISKLNDITILNYFNIDNDSNVYVMEGAFDAFHVKNAVAVLGASKGEHYIKKIKRRVYLYDCDQRGYTDSLKMAKSGEKVCLLWKYISEYKDINNYVVSTGDTDIMTKILNSIYSGTDAIMELFKIKRKYGYFDVEEKNEDKLQREKIDNILKRK